MLRPISTLLLLVSFSSYTIAQNWELFPINELNHYMAESEEISIRSFKADSVLTRDNSTINFFTRYMGPSEDCYWQNFKWLYGYGTDFTIDSLVYENNSVTYFFLEGDHEFDFVFNPLSRPGDEWNLSSRLSRKGTCISAGVSEFLGVTDSIKTFSLQTAMGEVEFILSKTHGFIQFMPFTFFFHEFIAGNSDINPFYYYDLIGFQTNDEIRGFQMPEFSDYFHLSAGDQVLWKHTFYEMIDLTTNYYLDSLVSSSITNESVNYAVKREVYDSNGQHLRSENTMTSYKKTDFDYLLQTPARWNASTDEEEQSELYFIHDMSIELSEKDTVYLKEFGADGCYLDTFDQECGVYCIDMDFVTLFRVSSIEGLTYMSRPFGNTMELLGSIIDGKLRGSMEIPVGIEKLSEATFTIFPNPTSGIIHLASDLEIHRVEIFNTLGILVHTSDVVDQINISDQTPGLYQFVAFTKSGERYIQAISLY